MKIITTPEGLKGATIRELWGDKCLPEVDKVLHSTMSRELKIAMLGILAFTTMEEKHLIEVLEKMTLEHLCTQTVDGWEKFNAMYNN